MPNNANWVCFSCRVVTRESAESARTPRCPTCGDECFDLGDRVAVPAKRNVHAWNALRLDCRGRQLKELAEGAKKAARLRHELQGKIAAQKELPQNAGRRRFLKELEERLSAVR